LKRLKKRRREKRVENLNKERIESICKSLFTDGASVYRLLREHIEERIEMHNKTGPTGDIFRDIPNFYMAAGAIKENNDILNMLEEFKRKHESQAP